MKSSHFPRIRKISVVPARQCDQKKSPNFEKIAQNESNASKLWATPVTILLSIQILAHSKSTVIINDPDWAKKVAQNGNK